MDSKGWGGRDRHASYSRIFEAVQSDKGPMKLEEVLRQAQAKAYAYHGCSFSLTYLQAAASARDLCNSHY